MTEENVLQWDGTGLALLRRRVVSGVCCSQYQRIKRRGGDGSH